MRVGGHSVLEQPLEVKARVGYVPESGALFEKFSPAEYLTLIGRLYGCRKRAFADRIAHWLRFFGLEAARTSRWATLSKGMKQKVCWIAALLHDPEVLVLDEPLNGLDVETVAHVKEMMRRWPRTAARSSTRRTSSTSSSRCARASRCCIEAAPGGGHGDRGRGELGAGSLEEALLRLGASA